MEVGCRIVHVPMPWPSDLPCKCPRNDTFACTENEALERRSTAWCIGIWFMRRPPVDVDSSLSASTVGKRARAQSFACRALRAASLHGSGSSMSEGANCSAQLNHTLSAASSRKTRYRTLVRFSCSTYECHDHCERSFTVSPLTL